MMEPMFDHYEDFKAALEVIEIDVRDEPGR